MLKKILLSSFLISSFALANAIEVTGNLQIKAEVVKPLTLTTEPLDFGIVAQGGTKTASQSGSIKIEGQAGRTVNLSFISNGADNNLFANDISLTHVDDENQTILYKPNVTLEGSKLNSSTISLNDGSAELKVNGTVTVASDASLGKYNTDVVVRVAYN